MISTTMTVELDPIRVPNYVTTTDGGDSIAVGNLSVEVLEALCVQFRVDLFKSAGKDLPK